MSRSQTSAVALLIAVAVMTNAPAEAQPKVAEAGNALTSVWHLGRVTGNLDAIVEFYCDVVGLDFRGDREEPITFYSVATINEFTGSPPDAEFRAAFLPIPGSAPNGQSADAIYLEALEYRHIDRRLQIPRLSDIGVTSLRFVVSDLATTLVALGTQDIKIVTAGGDPIAIMPPPGYSGAASAVMVRDPDGYPVELVAVAGLSPGPIGAQMTLIVADLPAALNAMGQLIGGELATIDVRDWSVRTDTSRLRDIEPAESRSAAVVLPASSIVLELIEFRGISQSRYEPKFQDIGFGHVAFRTNDIARVTATIAALGADTLSATGTWTQINDSTRAVYTRDPNGLFIEVIE